MAYPQHSIDLKNAALHKAGIPSVRVQTNSDLLLLGLLLTSP